MQETFIDQQCYFQLSEVHFSLKKESTIKSEGKGWGTGRGLKKGNGYYSVYFSIEPDELESVWYVFSYLKVCGNKICSLSRSFSISKLLNVFSKIHSDD